MAGSGVLGGVDAQGSIAVPTVGQWVPYDVSFSAEQNHAWYDFPLQVIFRHSGGKELQLDGYWDGGNSWKVRFAPPLPGSWTWTSTSNDPGLGGKSGSLNAEVPTQNQINVNPNYRGHVMVSPNGRYFTYADGTPFSGLRTQIGQ